ncbi:MAG: PAS domain-containing protein [Sphaerobacter sp.]|nr:PAS domain-containing protein [Sphaerobacter sp.]
MSHNLTDDALFLHAALDWVDEGVVLADPAGNIHRVTPQAAALLGRPVRHVTELGVPADACARVGRGEPIAGIRLPGSDAAVSVAAVPVRDAGGTVIGMVLILRPSAAAEAALGALQLESLAHAIASGRDIDTILAHTFGFLQPLIGCDHISLAVVDGDGEPVRLRVLIDQPTPISRILLAGEMGHVIRRVMAEGAPIIVEDTSASAAREDRMLLGEGIRSYAIYPLHGEQRILGTLNLSARQPRAFSAREMRVIERVVSHVALAVEKILLIESIEQQRQYLEQVLHHMPVGVLVVGPPPELRVRTANAHFRNFLDKPFRTEQEIVGLPLAALVSPGQQERVLPAFPRAFATGETVEALDVVVERPKRGTTHWNVWCVPLRDRTGRVEAVIALVVETTEQVRDRRRIEELAGTAAQQATALSAIIESMAEGVFVSDGTGQIVLVNEVGARLFGQTVEQVLQPLERHAQTLDVRYPDGRPIPPDEQPLARGLRGETQADWEQIVRRVDTGDDVHLLVGYSPIADDRGTIVGAVAVVSDVTRMRQLERQREEFLSIAAHELKTPVTSIKLFTQGMLRTLHRRGELGPERTERDLRTILEQIDRLTQLVDDLLDVSRIRTGRLEYRFERVDLGALVQTVVERFTTHLSDDERFRLRLHVTPGLPPVSADPTRIDQVITNLLSNALKYSPGGGTVTVRVGAAAAAGWLRIAVSDQGVGLDPAELPGLFQPFARATSNATVRNVSGIGLGLYISKEIVDRHGGRIWAQSAGQGRGTTFTVELPVTATAAGRSPGGPAA